MLSNNIVRLVFGIFAVAGSMGGCECQRDVLVADGPEIEEPTMVELEPHAQRPMTHFSSDLHTEDVGLNKFVEKALTVCEQGDYDSFRQLFGTAYAPPEKQSFQRVWHNVRDIQVGKLLSARSNAELYYLHAVIRFRETDQKERTNRDLVLTIFKEEGDWRLGTASKEISNRILRIQATQPTTTQKVAK
ncbi:MAG: hypothetical protein ACYTF1_11725 [Planctomycetota bacterium]|jgi:hypothetical protein